MPWEFDRYAPRKRRAAPADGIAAKAKRGDIGASWWSKRFIAVLEGITDSARLGRGRTYARAGQVSALVVAPGVVTARVQGSRPRPYEVRLTLKALDEPQWAAIEDALADQALFAAALLAGTMPREIEGVFTACGTPLFPTKAGELLSSCSCPDWANPCKHVAATYYILAERFDEDPFAMLAWRGRARESLLDGLRARRVVETAEPEPAADVPQAEASLASWWRASEEALTMHFPPGESPAPGAVLRQLGPLVVGGRDLTQALAAAYPVLEAGARRRA